MDSPLYDVFCTFASFADRLSDGTLMDGNKFAKLCRDCGVLDNNLTPTEVDMIFVRSKSKGERRIKFREFVDAVHKMAAAKMSTYEELRNAIVQAGGPILDKVHLPSVEGGVFEKLTSPQSLTGSSKKRFSEDGRGKGREGRVDEQDPILELRNVLRPEVARGGTLLSSAHADRRRELEGGSLSPSKALQLMQSTAPRSVGGGGGGGGGGGWGGGGGSGSGGSGPGGAPYSGAASDYSSHLRDTPSYTAATGEMSRSQRRAALASPSEQRLVEIDSAELESIFRAYCAFGTTTSLTTEMDSARFAKLCRENDIMDGVCVTPAAVDLAFARAIERAKAAQKALASTKAKQGGRIIPVRCLSYRDFQQALAVLAPLRHPDKVDPGAGDGREIVPALQATVEGIITCGGPAFNNVQLPQINATSVFSKLTDPNLYPNASKYRFQHAPGSDL